MSKKDKALKLALVKIRAAQMCHPNAVMTLIDEAEELLSEALADHIPDATKMIEQPAQQQAEQAQPVAWMDSNDDVFFTEEDAHKTGVAQIAPLYTAPPASKPWVGLTDDEVDECYYWKERKWTTDELVRHVEAKLKEKNNVL